MLDVTVKDHWIEDADGRLQGRLFVRSWQASSPSASDIPIILMHDSLGSVELWRSFPAELAVATGRTVIAYDRLGFGQSDPYPHKLAQDFVSDEANTGFAALVQDMGIDRFILFGHSVGGGMAVHCALAHGQACAALITESAQMFVEEKTVLGVEQARELFKDQKQLDRLRKFHGEKTEWVLDAWISTWLSPAFACWTLEPVLPQLTCPILAIHGAEDEYGTSRHPQLMGELAGGPVQVELMPDTRHVPHREKESEVVERVASFLQVLDL
ncbi:alpha/beta fold hydrolase [Granulosicoccus antarcticus]|uniref:2-succinyl-6-hydroxy-2, 4-cyclohexadiene-1-carboxylate synthase n=1 Tax=Granulosicoccus antarcticus IMCC3135 TaxID=1192854 RepID=A0A2Z2NXF3_9GAMM|nr:alpha/beta hydrolase [Granulosicoccus antarcticus]ASJ76132.1 2-succinyl-6-hydroxy-2,4-cyclohexadiene-1-carboxylate synthase [Granulosicoccus antarcticus IMCC3135]